jgi:large repetitive protein
MSPSLRHRLSGVLFVVASSIASITVGVDTTIASGASPASVDDTFVGRLGEPLVVASPGVLANDSDPEQDPLTVRLAYGDPYYYGTLELRPDGSFTYTPNQSNYGYDSFYYQAFDGTSWSTPSRVTILLYPAPVAVDDRYALLAGDVLAVPAPGVMANDTLGQPETVARVRTRPEHGRLRMNRDGSFRYVPYRRFVGVDTFTYSLIAGDGRRSRPATVTLRVVADNTLPTAVGDSYQLAEDTTLDVADPGVLSNDFDPDGDPLTIEVIDWPSEGYLDVRPGGGFSYQTDYNQDNDAVFTYRISDDLGWSEIVTVYLDVVAVNDPPIAQDDYFDWYEAGPMVVSSPGVLQNDFDNVEFDNPIVWELLTPPTVGSFVLGQDGDFVWDFPAGFDGCDFFTYRVGDSGPGGSASATMCVYPSNTLPTAVGDSFQLAEDTTLDVADPGVLSNDFDPDGDPLTIEVIDWPSEGYLDMRPGGGFSYQTDFNQDNDAVFTYRISDGLGWSEIVTVSLDVVAVNDPPFAQDDYFDWYGPGPMVVSAPGVLQNDFDNVEFDNPIVWELLTPPTVGSFVLGQGGDFVWDFPAGFEGCDSFTYRVGDSGPGGSAFASICVYP